MASLKEIKARMLSVNNTLKITSAMKMVSSAKLRKIQNITANLSRYKDSLFNILIPLFNNPEKYAPSALNIKHPEKKRIVIVAFSSNSSLCGSFNANVIRSLKKIVQDYRSQGAESIVIYPVGEKVSKACEREGYEICADFKHIVGTASYEETAKLARKLICLYEENEADQISVLYTRFISIGKQILSEETYLPVEIADIKEKYIDQNDRECVKGSFSDYIYEPSRDGILQKLLPYALSTKLFDFLLSSNASENAARMIAMQTATDNAKELLDELTLTYNKKRQQAITEEITHISNSN